MFSAQMCVLSRLNPNSLCISDLQESSDSSNTTVEDEDVKGKTAEKQNEMYAKAQVKYGSVCCE